MQNIKKSMLFFDMLANCGGVREKRKDKKLLLGRCLFVVVYAIIVLGTVRIQEDAGIMLSLVIIIMMCSYDVGLRLKHNPVMRGIPIADEEVVKAFFFYFPLVYLLPVVIAGGLLTFLYERLAEGGVAFFLQRTDLSVLIPLLLLAVAVWFFCVGMAFQSSLEKVLLILLPIAIVFAGLLYWNRQFILLRELRIVSLVDALQHLPKKPLWIGSAMLMVVSCIGNYQIALKNYKNKCIRSCKMSSYDVATPKKQTPVVVKQNVMVGDNKMLSKKGMASVIIFVSVAFVIMVGCCVFILSMVMKGNQSYEKIHVAYNDASEYDQWYQMEESIPKAIPLGYHEETVAFPSSVEADRVLYYQAGVFGTDYEESSYFLGCSAYRVLIQQLPNLEYQMEKERVAAISCQHTGEEENVMDTDNSILKDNLHFHGEAYIAEFNDKTESYQYVVFDDATRRVGYVYGKNVYMNRYTAACKSVMNLNPKNFEAVIPLQTANGSYNDYSIYNFYYQSEDGVIYAKELD